jgi:DNA-binding beta-propeller fold protein YncE
MQSPWPATLVAQVLAMAAVGSSPAAGIPDYRPVPGWPSLPADVELGQVSAVATDAADHVYVFHRGRHPVLVFDRDGKFLRSWGDDLVKTAHGLRVDGDNNVWVTDIGHHLVMKFDPVGKLLLTLGRKDQPGDGTDQFDRPTDVAVAPSGEFYVADGYGNSRVVEFSKDGKFLRQWGKKGGGEGEFRLPHAIRLDARGRVYVGDRENNRVQVFDSDGKFLEQWQDTGAPYGLFLTGEGRLFVADGRAHWVKVLDAQGKVLGRWGEKGKGPGQFLVPHGICVDSHRAVYVAEVDGRRVQKFVASEAPSPGIKVTPRRPDDSCQITAEQGKTTLDVTSPFGISRAVMQRVDEQWAGQIVVRLHLKGLENFRAGNGRVTVQGAAGVRDGKPDVRLWKGGKDTEELPRTDPLWTEVRIIGGDGKPAKEVPLKDGYFEIPLPRGLFEGNPTTVTLEWIDFYR